MTIAELGSIGELVGGIAVLVTLIYLAIQVRHSNQISLSQAYQARFDSRARLHLKEMGDDLPEILSRFAASPEEVMEMTEIDKAKLVAYMNYWLFYLDNVIYQEQLGLLDMTEIYGEQTTRTKAYEQINNAFKVLDIEIPNRVRLEFAKYDVT